MFHRIFVSIILILRSNFSVKHKVNDFFATTSKGTIMKIKSTRSFNVIPAAIIRIFLKLYLSNLLCKLSCVPLAIKTTIIVLFKILTLFHFKAVRYR